VLNDVETVLRLLAMMESWDLWPEEVRAVRRFLRKVYRLPTELVDPLR
jgi:hypothetical protein